jgi:hypothetical protein
LHPTCSGNARIGRFTCEQKIRTYVWPTLDMVKDILDACLVELVTNVREDAIWGAAGGA